MASLDDILTVQKNGVVAINGITKSNFPRLTSSVIQASTTTLITTGSGRIYSVSIPSFSGSGQIYIYDSATTASVAATNLIYSSLAANATNFIPYADIRLTYSKGLVLKTDANITFCVGYTPN